MLHTTYACFRDVYKQNKPWKQVYVEYRSFFEQWKLVFHCVVENVNANKQWKWVFIEYRNWYTIEIYFCCVLPFCNLWYTPKKKFSFRIGVLYTTKITFGWYRSYIPNETLFLCVYFTQKRSRNKFLLCAFEFSGRIMYQWKTKHH